MLYTPNSSSIGFQHLKEENNLVIPPLHLHYFNKKSLEMLIANKFELMFFETAGLDIGDIYAFERDSGDNDFCEFLKSNAEILQAFFDHIDYSNSLRAVIKKPD